MVKNLKCLFIAFERISGLKVNFANFELIPINLISTQSFHFTQILGYKLGKLSIKYLGVSLHWKKTSMAIWMELITKIQCRLQAWKRKILSMGGRLILLNSIFSSIFLYYLSLF
jgi:hypothetical protein